jgi:hypothetical protein
MNMHLEKDPNVALKARVAQENKVVGGSSFYLRDKMD